MRGWKDADWKEGLLELVLPLAEQRQVELGTDELLTGAGLPPGDGCVRGRRP